jgi:hypothetical protein
MGRRGNLGQGTAIGRNCIQGMIIGEKKKDIRLFPQNGRKGKDGNNQ